ETTTAIDQAHPTERVTPRDGCKHPAAPDGSSTRIDRRARRHRDGRTGRCPAWRRRTSPLHGGGPASQTANEKGQLRFPVLPPGLYVLDVELQGFATYHEEDILIGAGATIERTTILKLAGLAESVVVEGTGSRIEARDPGFATRFGPEDLAAIPVRRVSMF